MRKGGVGLVDDGDDGYGDASSDKDCCPCNEEGSLKALFGLDFCKPCFCFSLGFSFCYPLRVLTVIVLPWMIAHASPVDPFANFSTQIDVEHVVRTSHSTLHVNPIGGIRLCRLNCFERIFYVVRAQPASITNQTPLSRV